MFECDLIRKNQIIKNISICFSYLISIVLNNKESHGSEAVFGSDVDYFGDFYRTRSSPNKQEEPIGSVCQIG